MQVQIKTIQIIQINVNKLSTFPKERIEGLISELNIHYDKINGYLECEVPSETLNVEVVDCLAKLNEIARLAPVKFDKNSYRDDFQLGIALLESVIALLEMGTGHNATKQKLLDLGWNLLGNLYDFSVGDLELSSLRYQWLKNKGLIKQYNMVSYRRRNDRNLDESLSAKFTEHELEEFYQKNKQYLYEYMAFYMKEGKQEFDQLDDTQASNFYRYHQTLAKFQI